MRLPISGKAVVAAFTLATAGFIPGIITGRGSSQRELANELNIRPKIEYIRQELDKDTFTRLQKAIECSEPPITRPVKWDKMFNSLYDLKPGETAKVAVEKMLEALKSGETVEATAERMLDVLRIRK